MVYRAIGLMSGSSLDGLDIAFVEFLENGGKWSYEIMAAETIAYPDEWKTRLEKATRLPALEYQLLHTAYGHYTGEQVNNFIDAHQLQYKVALIASHGHTTFHLPAEKMTAQLGDGAAIAATTRLPVVTDLRAMDVAAGGQGAPIVPMGEKLLFPGSRLFLNLGGIANLSIHSTEGASIAFDVCPANRVLNLLAALKGKEYDEGGNIAATGQVNEAVLAKLNGLDFYQQSYPRSLANDFGTGIIYPLLTTAGLSTEDALRTYVAHIITQVSASLQSVASDEPLQLLVTGGGAFNKFLMHELQDALQPFNITIGDADEKLINYKEALIMALLGVLRWREEITVLASVTGATRDTVGGAMWMGS